METLEYLLTEPPPPETLPAPGASYTAVGVVVREIYRSADFAVISLALGPENSAPLITVTGSLPQLKTGEQLSVTGKVVNSKYGRQLKAEKVVYHMPEAAEGIERFLASGLITGVGPQLARRIVKRFGDAALQILDADPNQYLNVTGIGPENIKNIVAAWQQHKASRQVISLLQEHDISINLAIRVCKCYGSAAVQIIHANPYRLAYDIPGIGFIRADQIAASLRIHTTDPRRIQAGLYFALHQSTQDGHTYLPVDELIAAAAALLSVDPRAIAWQLQIEETDHDSKLILDTLAGQKVCYLKPYHRAETAVAASIRRLLSAPHTCLTGLDLQTIHPDPRLSPEQTQAVIVALASPISIITGGPGCGKSFLVYEIVRILDSLDKTYALAAPTGRAAKRLSEATDRPAQTIHRLLGLTGENNETPSPQNLQANVVIIDEMSMVDLPLINKLLHAIPTGAHLVLVGDVDQLPSVGAGAVLSDLIQSAVVPVTRLTHIFRQAQGSQIIANAHRINRGQMPLLDNHAEDFFFFGQPKETIAPLVVELVTQKIPARFGYTPDQIQVLTPMQKGDNGVRNLNRLLQNALNPLTPGKTFHAAYRLGDRVMQTRNNYDKNVFNGDIGRILSIDPHAPDQNAQAIVEFDGLGPLPYTLEELTDQLVLSYAITIHKSQGGEYPCAVIILSTEHYIMLQRNLLYTAVTRSKQLCILVGRRPAINMAVTNNQVRRRYTGLIHRLQPPPPQ